MENQKKCISCGRMIAGAFRFCPYCDIDQTTGAPFRKTRSGGADVIYRCGGCGKGMDPANRYCVHCGTGREQGRYMTWDEFERYYIQPMQCVYGPAPVKRQHKCTVCGYTYEVAYMIDKDRYCPQCGGATEMTELGYDW